MENFFRGYILSSKHEEGLGEFEKVKHSTNGRSLISVRESDIFSSTV